VESGLKLRRGDGVRGSEVEEVSMNSLEGVGDGDRLFFLIGGDILGVFLGEVFLELVLIDRGVVLRISLKSGDWDRCSLGFGFGGDFFNGAGGDGGGGAALRAGMVMGEGTPV